MKVKFRDKVIGIVLILVLTTCAVFNYIVFPANTKVEQLNKEKDAAAALISNTEPLAEKIEDKEAEVSTAKNKYNIIRSEEAYKTATSEEFLVFLGSSAEKNNVKVTGFSDLGFIYESGLYKSYYDIELSGMPFEINRAIKELDSMGIKYSAGSVSFRQDKEYDYLKRFFDSMTNLSWYKEPQIEEKEEIEETNTETEETPKTENIEIPSQKPEAEMPKQEENIIHKNEIIQGAVIEPEKSQGSVLPEDKNIEDRLNELLKTRAVNLPYKVIPLTNTISSEMAVVSNEMRLSFTVCLTMFNEPSEETSFINITEAEDEDGVF